LPLQRFAVGIASLAFVHCGRSHDRLPIGASWSSSCSMLQQEDDAMQHVTGYLTLALALLTLIAGAAVAAEPAVSAPATRIERQAPTTAPAVRGTTSNLDPASGPVVSDPHALPADAVNWKSDSTLHTWGGYSAN
jgi:hypothetical protein